MSCKRRKTSPVRLVYLSSEVVTPSSRLPVELLWIDGDDRYSAVRRDFEPWEPHLRGKVSFHDAIQESDRFVLPKSCSRTASNCSSRRRKR
jgi:hypothetical protein